jgi:predicted nucleic acid-binding Zn ribbon protein
MSGSNSSARDASGRAEPLALTVHALPAPELPAETRRTRAGRLKMLLVLLVCAAPVVASYFAYFVVRPQARTNYGTLILPTRTMPPLPLRALDGQEVAAATLKGQWLLVALGPSRCAEACQERLYMQRQLREMLGRERDRLDKVWLVTDAGALAPALRDALAMDPAPHVLRIAPEALSGWLQAESGRRLDEHLYLIDPMGEWMMRMPADADPARVKGDLDKLLRASASWDRRGR